MIATVVLTAAAAVGGSVLAGQDRDRDTGQGQQQNPPPDPVGTPETTGPAEDPTPEVTSTGRPCRPETQEAAQGRGATGLLTEVLKLRTRTSVVWICEDQAGRYYYHANRGGESARWVENETALFLSGVTGEGDAWVAVASDGTRFSVNVDRLLIIHKDGREEEQPAA